MLYAPEPEAAWVRATGSSECAGSAVDQAAAGTAYGCGTRIAFSASPAAFSFAQKWSPFKYMINPVDPATMREGFATLRALSPFPADVVDRPRSEDQVTIGVARDHLMHIMRRVYHVRTQRDGCAVSARPAASPW